MIDVTSIKPGTTLELGEGVVAEVTERGLVRAKVSDVVSGIEADAVRVEPLLLHVDEHRKERAELPVREGAAEREETAGEPDPEEAGRRCHLAGDGRAHDERAGADDAPDDDHRRVERAERAPRGRQGSGLSG